MTKDSDDRRAAAQELLGNRPKLGLSRDEILNLVRDGRDERDRKALPLERVTRQQN